MTLPIPIPTTTARLIAAALLAAVLAAVPIAALAADEPEATPDEGFIEWVARMGAFYESHPELKTEPGSGWKPYNRAKWFFEQRMVNGQEIPADGRWNAFLRKRELEQLSNKQASAQWFSLGPTNLSGRILALEFDPNDPNTLYTGAAGGGIWKSINGGVTWAALDDELPTLAVGAIAVLPTNSNVVIIGTGEATNNIDRVGGVGILRSTDAGATWMTTSISLAASSGHGFHCMEANPVTGSILAGSTSGLYRSTDEGATWDTVKVGGDWTDVAWKPGTTDSVYLVRSSEGVAPSGIRLSVDDGITSLPKFSVGLPAGQDWGKTKMAVTPANADYIYVSIADQASGNLLGIYRSTNAGASWTLQSSSPNIYNSQGWYNNSLAADPNDADRIIAGGVGLYRSTNGGTTLNSIGSGVVHVDHHAVAYRPGTTDNVFVGSDGGVWESTNDGSNWSDRNSGLVTYQFYDICVSQPNPLLSLGGTQDQGTDRWTGTTTWLQGLGADGMVCNCDVTNPLLVYGEIQFGEHYVSANGGANWGFASNGLGNASWVAPVDLDPTDGQRLFTAANAGIYKTTNGGNTWIQQVTGNATWISISPVAPDTVWAIQGALARFTTDDGATWTNASFFPFGTSVATKILAHPTDPMTAFVTFSGYTPSLAHIARTTDLGVTWEDLTGDFPDQPVNAIAVDPQNTNLWFIGTDVGVWASANGGAHWEPYETGFPNAVVADLEIQNSSRKLRAGTHGRGLWEVDITGATSVSPGVAQSINLMLDPPYPNPAGDGAVLRYAARNPGNVTLSVYDVQGRLVTHLADHAADGAIRHVRWDSARVPDGVYFARLTSSGQEKTQKLIVVR